MPPPTSVTGIPIEILFSVIGVLVALIYGDIKYELRRLRKESHERSNAIIQLRMAVSFISQKLGITFDTHDRREDS